jgi:hypothetical protein
MGKTRNTGKLATQIQFDNSNNLVIGTSASSSFNTSGSVNAIGGITGSIFGIGNPTSFSSSISSDLNSIHDVTTSNISRLNSIEEKTGSFATTGSNSFYGTQVFSGSVFIASDLIVQGSSSIQYISASSVSIGTNIVQLNTATPSVRFAGVSVQDSGSSAGVTGSILWDSLCNRWIYSNPSTIGYSGGMLMSGPRTSTLGTESPLTCNYIAKSGGGDHLYDSCIIDDGTTVCVNANLRGSGTGIFSGCLTFGDWTTDTNVLTSNKPNEQGAYIRAAVSTASNPTYTFEDDRDTGMYRDSANTLGFTTTGTSRLIIASSGVACFSNYLQAGGYYATGPVTVGIPFDTGGTKAYFDGSSINGPALSLVSDSVGRTIRLSATTGSTAVGKIDMNCGEMNIGTNVSLPFSIYTNNFTRVTTTSTGITCFACQVCAPYYGGGTSYTIDFLVVAGGGGGGGSEMSNGFGGGGGAGGGGGYLASSISVNCGSTYPIVVGTGGVGGASCLATNGSGLPGCPGTFSSAFGFIAIGGGAGAGDEGTAANTAACQSGGSGGGRGGDSGGIAGIAVIGQGNNGGPNVSRSGGGGGGAAQTTGGNTGGAGRQWLDTNYYAGGGGGGGGGNDQTQWLGGVGGGGNGSRSFPGGGTTGEAGGQATAGQACTGGGGGGAGSGYLQGGMAGGSGIVIIRYFGCTRGSGGTVSSSGGYTYHRFGANGTYTA